MPYTRRMDPISWLVILGSIISLLNTYRLVCTDRRRKHRRELARMSAHAEREDARGFGIIEAVALADRIARPGSRVLLNTWDVDLPDEGNAWLISQFLLSEPTVYRSLLDSTERLEVAETARIAKQKRDEETVAKKRKLDDFVKSVLQGAAKDDRLLRELARDRQRTVEDLGDMRESLAKLRYGGRYSYHNSQRDPAAVLEGRIADKVHRLKSYDRQLTSRMENEQNARAKEISDSVRVLKIDAPPDYSPEIQRMLEPPKPLEYGSKATKPRFVNPGAPTWSPAEQENAARYYRQHAPVKPPKGFDSLAEYAATVEASATDRDTAQAEHWRMKDARYLRIQRDSGKISAIEYLNKMKSLYENPEF